MAYRILAAGGAQRLADGACIPPDGANADWRAYQDWLAAGGSPQPAEQPPAPRRLIEKGVIVERLIAAGKIEAARAALAQISVADQERWNAKPAVYADDARALALLRAIGADPAVILAP